MCWNKEPKNSKSLFCVYHEGQTKRGRSEIRTWLLDYIMNYESETQGTTYFFLTAVLAETEAILLSDSV